MAEWREDFYVRGLFVPALREVFDGVYVGTESMRAWSSEPQLGWGLGLSAWPPSCRGPVPRLARAQKAAKYLPEDLVA
ncbi:MAG: hypothetical protein J7L75_01375, partial [Thermoproteales archaeon]|nr:hypothetical protein [Thermoproteales archaeon]